MYNPNSVHDMYSLECSLFGANYNCAIDINKSHLKGNLIYSNLVKN